MSKKTKKLVFVDDDAMFEKFRADTDKLANQISECDSIEELRATALVIVETADKISDTLFAYRDLLSQLFPVQSGSNPN